MSAHAYSEDQLVEQPIIVKCVTNGIVPAIDWRWALFKSLAACRCKIMFSNSFLFEWETSE